MCLRKNTVSLNLSGIPERLTPLQIHKLIEDKFKLPKETVRNIEIVQKKVFIGFNSFSTLSNVITNFGSSIEYKHVSGIIYHIPLVHEDRVIKVKVHHIPFEAGNAIISEVLSKYGEVLSITNDLWENPLPYQVYNGTKSVSMVLFSPIPSYVNIFGNKTSITYEGQRNTCKFCESIDHDLEDCSLDIKYLEDKFNHINKTKFYKEDTLKPIEKVKTSITNSNDTSTNCKLVGNSFSFGGTTSVQKEVNCKDTLQSYNPKIFDLGKSSLQFTSTGISSHVPHTSLNNSSNKELSIQSHCKNPADTDDPFKNLFNFQTLPTSTISLTSNFNTSLPIKALDLKGLVPSLFDALQIPQSTSRILNNTKNITDRLGEKSVKDLPGVYGNLAVYLTNNGYSKAYHVLGQFLYLKKNKELFTKWLKNACDVQSAQIEECYNYLFCYCLHFI